MYNLAKKALIIIVFSLIYFLGIREARAFLHGLHLGTILPDEYGVFDEGISFDNKSSVSFSFYTNFDSDEVSRVWSYKIPFGLFFLLAVLGLILLDSETKYYYYISVIQLIALIFSIIGLLLAKSLSAKFLVIPDIISLYLLPLCSLGLVALVFIAKKEEYGKE